MNVMSKEECQARETVLHNHYTGTVEMEALCLIDMINQHIIPSVKAADVGPLEELQAAVPELKAALAAIHAAGSPYEAAKLARVLRLETMISVRQVCDAAEEVVPAHLWTLATYKELLFMDSHVGPGLEEIYE
jgi:glutamine synthetase